MSGFLSLMLNIVISCSPIQEISMKTKPISMRKKLILIFIVSFTLPLIASSIIFINQATRTANVFQEENNKKNIRIVGYAFSKILSDSYDYTLFLSLNANVIEYLQSDATEIYEKQLNYNVQEVVSTIVHGSTSITSLQVVRGDGSRVYTGTPQHVITDEDKIIADSKNGKPFWIRRYVNGAENLTMVRLLKNPKNINQRLGYVAVDLSVDYINNIIGSLDDVDHEFDYNYVIRNDDDKVVYTSVDDVESLESGDFKTTSLRLDDINSTLVQYSSNYFPSHVNNTLYGTYKYYIIICLIFCFFLATIFTRIIMNPLRKLGERMNDIENGDFDKRINPEGDGELALLSRQFDTMADKLQSSYEEVYLATLHEKEARLAMLQAQINPHFLYNTLDTIYWMSEMHHTKDISDMVASLSKLFRLSLAKDETPLIPLSKELEHLETYARIQTIRHGDDLTFRIKCNVTKTLLVPRLILQPLVENAILHGIDKVGHGEVEVNITASDKILCYHVIDSAGLLDADAFNKKLMEPDELNKEGFGIGINNINNRIKLISGKQYGIFAQNDGYKTTMSVVLPIEIEGEV